MIHKFNAEFLTICEEILSENKTLTEWALIESDDMFQQGNYIGGFDGTEMEFCFSVIESPTNTEYWFQLSLKEIKDVKDGIRNEVEVRIADY